MQELVKLIAENPGLPVIAMVNGEVCWDDCSYWLGSFSTASIEKVGLVDERYYDDVDSFKEAYYDKHDEELCERFNYTPRCCVETVEQGKYTQEQFEANCLAEEKLEEYLDEIVDKYMVKAITVYVDTLDASVIREAE